MKKTLYLIGHSVPIALGILATLLSIRAYGQLQIDSLTRDGKLSWSDTDRS